MVQKLFAVSWILAGLLAILSAIIGIFWYFIVWLIGNNPQESYSVYLIMPGVIVPLWLMLTPLLGDELNF